MIGSLALQATPLGVPMSVRIASCSCGQLRAEVLGEPTRVSVCHCYACQRRTGSVFSVQAGFPRESVTIKGDGTEFVRVGDQGGRFRYKWDPGTSENAVKAKFALFHRPAPDRVLCKQGHEPMISK